MPVGTPLPAARPLPEVRRRRSSPHETSVVWEQTQPFPHEERLDAPTWVACSDDRGFAVRNKHVAMWDGAAWFEVPTPATNDIQITTEFGAVAPVADSSGRLFVVAGDSSNTRVLFWDGWAWSGAQVIEDIRGFTTLGNRVYGVTTRDLLVLNGYPEEPVPHLDRHASGTMFRLNAIAGRHNELFLGGESGVVIHYSNNPRRIRIDPRLPVVAFSVGARVLALLKDGSVFARTEHFWRAVSIPPTFALTEEFAVTKRGFMVWANQRWELESAPESRSRWTHGSVCQTREHALIGTSHGAWIRRLGR
ncbi:MAG: hypothetical protein AAGE52_35640 [Myxococcota bacterium]